MRSLTCLVVLLAALAGTAHASTSAIMTIKLVSVTTKASSGAAPADPGRPAREQAVNALKESDRLYNATRQFGKAAKAQVGTDRAVLTHFASGRAWMEATATLPGGTIHTRGYVRHVELEALVPVVGGTGRYAHATGWLSIRDVGTSNFAANIYTLRR